MLNFASWACSACTSFAADERSGRKQKYNAGSAVGQRAIMLEMPMVALATLGGALLLANWPFDKQVFSALPSLTSEFIEDMLALSDCLVLLSGSPAD